IALRTDLVLLSGDDTLTLPMASVGGVGVVSVVSNLVPQKVADLCRAFLEGDWEAARILHAELFGLSRGLLSLATNPIAVKAALQILGRDTGAVRLPLWPPDQETRQAIEDMVAVSGLRAAELPV
ncbi:MAG: dihydrodipicolinate synthase family protein, partial [Phycisphaeraceae bacterium]